MRVPQSSTGQLLFSRLPLCFPECRPGFIMGRDFCLFFTSYRGMEVGGLGWAWLRHGGLPAGGLCL